MATLRDQIAAWTKGGAFKPVAKRAPVQMASSATTSETAPLPSPAATPHVVQMPAVPKQTPPAPARPLAKDLSPGYFATKIGLHKALLKRMDLAAAESLPEEQIRSQLAHMVDLLISEGQLPVNEHEHRQLIIDLQNEVLGLGPLEPLLADHSISEIMVNGFDKVFVERKGRLELVSTRFNDNDHLMKVIDKIVSRVGRRVDESSPMADARLADGSRVNAIVPPVAIDGPALSIRRFEVIPLKMTDLIAKHALTAGMAELLAGFVKSKVNILISGGTGSGKTTLLNILSGYIPEGERIITIEDTAELQLQQSHVVRLETRTPNLEGTGEVTMRSLVKNSLRMRPDRIVLGEVRGSEVIDMLQAMNTGHDGSLTTVHANSPRDALSRLENLVGLGGVNLPVRALRQQISSGINVIVQASRLNDGSRKITSIHEITGMEGDVITTQEIFFFDRQGMNPDGSVMGSFRATGVRPQLAEKLITYGIVLDESLFDPTHPLDDSGVEAKP
jgi:pilus assembly protein CpaF